MRKRFFRAATLSIAVGLVIAFLFAVPLMEQIYTDETQQRLETALSLAEGYAASDGYPALAERVGSRAEGLRFSVMGPDGAVLGDSAGRSRPYGQSRRSAGDCRRAGRRIRPGYSEKRDHRAAPDVCGPPGDGGKWGSGNLPRRPAADPVRQRADHAVGLRGHRDLHGADWWRCSAPAIPPGG